MIDFGTTLGYITCKGAYTGTFIGATTFTSFLFYLIGYFILIGGSSLI
jgi:hypothetical protein